MDLKDIRELVKLIDKSSVNELEIRTDKERIRIAKNADVQYLQQPMSAPAIQQNPTQVSSAPVSNEVPATDVVDNSNFIEVKSPMVGTYYSASSPDADPFVSIGDSIKSGQALCIIEAMKLMNEIQSEHSGKLAKILVNNGDPVEYNQVLFLLTP